MFIFRFNNDRFTYQPGEKIAVKTVKDISNASGKGMCKDESYVDYLKRTIDWRMTH